MKIPRNIEWRAGALLLCAAIILLSLLIALTLVRTDVGLKVEGVMSLSETGWTLTTEIPEGQLAMLRSCKHIYLINSEVYGQISNINVSLLSPSGICAKIKISDLKLEAASDTSQTLQAMLIKSKKVPVLKMLLDSVFNRQRA